MSRSISCVGDHAENRLLSIADPAAGFQLCKLFREAFGGMDAKDFSCAVKRRAQTNRGNDF